MNKLHNKQIDFFFVKKQLLKKNHLNYNSKFKLHKSIFIINHQLLKIVEIYL